MQRRLATLFYMTGMLLFLLLCNVTPVYTATAEPLQPNEYIYLPRLVRAPQPASPHLVVEPSTEWTAEWWQWIERMNNAPVNEQGAVDCSAGQEGAVWFLAGTQGGAPVVRSCTVPGDKTFLVPVYTVAWHNEAGENLNVDEKRQVLADIFSDQVPGPINSEICLAEGTIDGTAVNALQLQSPPFHLGADPEAVSDGFWFAFQLEPGSHQITFIGRLCDFGTTNTQNEVNVTYNLTVDE
jgi:hypothetical protein